MNERERILDLVKKGVLSTDEALDLLESIAKAKDTTQIKKLAEEVHAENKEKKEADEPEVDQSTEEEFSNRFNELKAESEEISVEIQGITSQILEIEESIMQLNTKEELGDFSSEEGNIRIDLDNQKKSLLEKRESLKEEKKEIDEQIQAIKQKHYQFFKEKLVEKFDIPEDWREQATEKINFVSDKVLTGSTKVGGILKKTLKSVTEMINDNVEWKDLNVKVPGVATTKFEKEFQFDEVQATIIDIKVANGKVLLTPSEDEKVCVHASVKLYGKFGDESPEEIFAERSDLSVTTEKISIQIPNKRIYADLHVSLPRKIYDHVSLKMLNGSVTMKNIEGKDFYVKTTNGDIHIEGVTATMLELEGVNGDLLVEEGMIRDTVIESLNGDVTLKTTPETVSVSLVNGSIKLSFNEESLTSLKARLVNGDIKVAIPKTLGLSVHAKTNLGAIKNRLSEIEITREKKEKMNQFVQLERIAEKVATIDLETATGSIFLKETEE